MKILSIKEMNKIVCESPGGGYSVTPFLEAQAKKTEAEIRQECYEDLVKMFYVEPTELKKKWGIL